MKFLIRFIWAEARANPGRLMPGLLAMCISVAMVIWMMGNYDALVNEFDEEADAYMGIYSFSIVPDPVFEGRKDMGPVIRALREDPAVERVDTAEQVRLPIGRNGSGKGGSFDDVLRNRMGIPSQSPVLVGTDASICPYTLQDGSWPDMSATSEFVGVLGSASAEFFHVGTGDILSIRSGANVYDIRVSGVVHQLQAHPDISPALRQGAGPAIASFFVPSHVFEQITGHPFVPNLVNVCLKDPSAVDAFRQKWESMPELAGLVFADTGVIQKRLKENRSVRQIKSSAESAAGMVLFACVFIIFTTLSMGVTERTRKLALLRVLGLNKRQVFMIVAGESLLLAIPAFLLGCIAGYILLVWLVPEGMSGGLPMPGTRTLLTAFACSAGGALLAGIVPAWRATRLLPLEACSDQWLAPSRFHIRQMWIPLLTGLACWGVQPLILILPGLDPGLRKSLFAWLGYPGLIAGTILLAPVAVALIEKFFTRGMAMVLRVNRVFLEYQLTANIVRTSGTVIAMTVGLGLYMAVQIWGYSMVVPFVPDKTMPDTLVSFLHNDYEGAGLEQMMKETRLDRSGLHPILVEEPDIAPEQLNSPEFHAINQKSVVVAGIPLDRMMQGDKASLQPELAKNELSKLDMGLVLSTLKNERSLLIPDTFAKATGLKSGDVLKLVAPDGEEVQDWKIAAVVSMPGWHWLTKTSGMRVRRGHFIAALAIADEGQVSKAFGVNSVKFFWGNVQGGMKGRKLQQALQNYVDREKTDPFARPLVKVSDMGQLGGRVEGMADRSISAMSKLPMIALLIGSLALLNAVLAGVNARRREFALMHAVGVSRATLFRAVLAESLMIGMAVVALSFLFGLVSATSAIDVLEYGYAFGGVTPGLTIPWLHLAYGAAVTLALCFLPLLLVRLKRKIA